MSSVFSAPFLYTLHPRPVFSATYKMLFLQLLSFHIDAKKHPGVGWLRRKQKGKIPLTPLESPKTGRVSSIVDFAQLATYLLIQPPLVSP
jgi:hypothetical protein